MEQFRLSKKNENQPAEFKLSYSQSLSKKSGINRKRAKSYRKGPYAINLRGGDPWN
jgi:hypothetical protein